MPGRARAGPRVDDDDIRRGSVQVGRMTARIHHDGYLRAVRRRGDAVHEESAKHPAAHRQIAGDEAGTGHMEPEDPRLEDLRVRLRPGCPLAYEEEVLVVCRGDGPGNDIGRGQWAAYASPHRASRGGPHRRLFPIRSITAIRDHAPHDVIPRYAAVAGHSNRAGMTA